MIADFRFLDPLASELNFFKLRNVWLCEVQQNEYIYKSLQAFISLEPLVSYVSDRRLIRILFQAYGVTSMREQPSLRKNWFTVYSTLNNLKD
jgi:hypothetical protein